MDVLHVSSFLEQGRDVIRRESCDATTYWSNEECLFGMGLGIVDELIDVWPNGFYATLHGRDSIALSLRTVAIANDGTKVLVRHSCGTAAVHTGKLCLFGCCTHFQ